MEIFILILRLTQVNPLKSIIMLDKRARQVRAGKGGLRNENIVQDATSKGNCAFV